MIDRTHASYPPRASRFPRTVVPLLIAASAICSLSHTALAEQSRKAVKPAAAPTAARAAGALQSYTEKIPGSLATIDMVAIPAGTITVADKKAPGGKRTVQLAPFWIGKTELQWPAHDAWTMDSDLSKSRNPKADAISKPSKSYIPPDRGYGHQNYAVISESIQNATSYCKWLSLVTGMKYRLPTVAEWEYAARAGDKRVGPLPRADVLKIAWVKENASDQTNRVAKKAPNAWGIYDVLGNVGEWCTDMNGVPVLAGGSFVDPAAKVNYGTRAYYSKDWQMTDPQNPKSKWWLADGPFVGFRIVRVP